MPDEAQRLSAVDRFAGALSSPDNDLNRIASLASAISGCPISLVSIVDDTRQFFPGSHGLTGVWETEREASFCWHAISDQKQLAVNDAEADARFRSNRLVTDDPKIRAYAGSPIEVDGGQLIGSVCVIDQVPRSFEAPVLKALDDLASLASSILKLHDQQSKTGQQLAQLNHQKQLLWEKATHDALTDLPNRAHFKNVFENTYATQGAALAFLLIDVDGFKSINDQLGHCVGDKCLREIGAAIKHSLRQGDFVARFGGDEFVAIVRLDNTRQKAIVEEIFGRIQRRLSTVQIPEDPSFLIRISAGAALKADRTPFDDLYKKADTALYQAKGRGRDQLVFYTESTHHESPTTTSRNQLFEAIEEGRIIPYYQPKIDLRSGDIVGIEALARWKSADGSIMAPGQFSHVFDNAHTSKALAHSMLSQTIADYANFSWNGSKPPRLALNASAFELAEKSFARDVLDAVSLAGLSPHQLTIEVTENAVLGSEGSQCFETLVTLRQEGVMVAFDDFGRGYGTIAHLASWPIDRIKFDHWLVQKAAVDQRTQRVVSGIVDIVNDLGMSLVAEGIETVEQLELCLQMGFDIGQGYLFGKPMPYSQLTAYVREYKPNAAPFDCNNVQQSSIETPIDIYKTRRCT